MKLRRLLTRIEGHPRAKFETVLRARRLREDADEADVLDASMPPDDGGFSSMSDTTDEELNQSLGEAFQTAIMAVMAKVFDQSLSWEDAKGKVDKLFAQLAEITGEDAADGEVDDDDDSADVDVSDDDDEDLDDDESKPLAESIRDDLPAGRSSKRFARRILEADDETRKRRVVSPQAREFAASIRDED